MTTTQPAPAPLLLDRVRAALISLADGTNFTEHEVAAELSTCSPRELAAYATTLRTNLQQLTTLVGAAINRAEHFTGTDASVWRAERALAEAAGALHRLVTTLAPADGSLVPAHGRLAATLAPADG